MTIAELTLTLKKIGALWSAFFFTPSEPLDLAICRVFFFGGISLLYLFADFRPWAGVSQVFWMPISLFAVSGVGVLSTAEIGALQALWKICLVFVCLGFFTRPSAATAAIVGTYLLGLQNSMGKTDHFDAIVLFVCAIFAVAKPSPVYSVDGWLRARSHNAALLNSSGEYTWPIRAVWLTLSLIFFASGFAKIRNSGLAWITSDNMAVMLIKQHYWASPTDPVVNWGLWIASRPWLYHSIAALTLALELFYPLALISARIRAVIVPAMMATQIGIFLVMGPWFPQFLLANVFWAPWTWVARSITRRESAEG